MSAPAAVRDSAAEVDEAALRADIVRVAKAMDAQGFAPSKSGNVSARIPGGLLITPSGLPYAAMQPGDVVAVADDGSYPPTARRPSSEWRMHAGIYAARPEVLAIVHTHSPKATALSCARRPIPALHYMIALTGGSEIPCADYATFATAELAANAARALGTGKAVLLANHGVIACGPTLDNALAVATETENLAGQYLMLLAAGLEPVILDAPEMERVHAMFVEYGRAKRSGGA